MFRIVLFTISMNVFMSLAVHANNIDELRKSYLSLEHAAKYGSRSDFLRLSKKLKDYPLTPYAESLYLQRRMSLSNKKHIVRLLEQYPDAPFTRVLRKKWLNYLADKQLRQAFLEQYQDVDDARLECLNLTWQLQNGAARNDILPKVDELWIAPFSQPKACNYLFSLWQKDGYLTPNKALKRIKLASKEKNYALLPYLKTFLPENQKHLASLWKLATKRPANVAKKGFFLKFDAQEKEILLYAVNRLAFVSPEKVETLWRELANRFPISEQEQQKVVKKLAVAFAINNHESSLDWLLNVPEEVVDESIKQWRLAYSLQNGDWQNTLNVLNTLPEQLQADESVLYWQARALSQLGEQQWANNAFSELSERRDYYGFLAASKVGVKSNLRHVPIDITEREFIKVGRSETLQRAFELFKLNRHNDARREWNLLTVDFTDREKLAAAKLAFNWGWYDRPIFTLAEVGYMNDVSLRFPLAYKETVAKNAAKLKLDPAFVFAIARRESSFMQDAYSDAGAAGLMQLRPSTASYVAKSKVKRSQLFKPEKNIKLASNYLSYLLKKSKGNPIVATAAYNAGFSKVKRWLPEQNMSADAWIETIPYKETRNYVKAVMAYTEVYQQLLDKPENIFSESMANDIAPSL